MTYDYTIILGIISALTSLLGNIIISHTKDWIKPEYFSYSRIFILLIISILLPIHTYEDLSYELNEGKLLYNFENYCHK
jgi:hypothetical protein